MSEDFMRLENMVREYTLPKSNMSCMNALMGELGELANVLKKEEFMDHLPDYKEQVFEEVTAGTMKPIREQKLDEAGDTLFYFVQLIQKEGLNLHEIMDYQANKLNNQSIEKGSTFLK